MVALLAALSPISFEQDSRRGWGGASCVVLLAGGAGCHRTVRRIGRKIVAGFHCWLRGDVSRIMQFETFRSEALAFSVLGYWGFMARHRGWVMMGRTAGALANAERWLLLVMVDNRPVAARSSACTWGARRRRSATPGWRRKASTGRMTKKAPVFSRRIAAMPMRRSSLPISASAGRWSAFASRPIPGPRCHCVHAGGVAAHAMG